MIYFEKVFGEIYATDFYWEAFESFLEDHLKGNICFVILVFVVNEKLWT
jgi:hypothetical protein